MYEFSKNDIKSYLINQQNLKTDRNIRVMIRISKSNNHKSIKLSNNNNKTFIKNEDNLLSPIFQKKKETPKSKKIINPKKNFKNSFQQTGFNPVINSEENYPFKTDFYELQKGLIIKTVRFHDFCKSKKNFDKERIKTILKNHSENSKKDSKEFQYYLPIHSIYFEKRNDFHKDALYQKNKIKIQKIYTVYNTSAKTDDKLYTENKILKNKTFFPLINQKDIKNKTHIKFFDKKIFEKNNLLNIDKLSVFQTSPDITNIKASQLKLKEFNKIQGYKILKRISMISQPGSNDGITKINQDCYFMLPEINKCQKIKIFGIFDGHGVTGEKISEEIKEYFKNYFINLLNDSTLNIENDDDNTKNNFINTNKKKNFLKEYFTSKFKTKKIKFNISKEKQLRNISINSEEKCDKIMHIYNKISSNNYSEIYSSFKKLDEILHIKYSSTNICHLSGSTALIIFLFNSKNCNKIISSNLGDSKIILISKKNKIKELNSLHTLDNIEEKNRIKQKGAVINPLNVGPLRIWFKNKNYPGLSITRSLGDFESDSLGVITTPDIKEYDLDEENTKIIIFGTDGFWKFLTNEKVMDTILPYYEQNDIEGGIQKLKEIAYNLWKTKNPRGIADITVFVLFFK